MKEIRKKIAIIGAVAFLLILSAAAFPDRINLDVSISNPYLLASRYSSTFLKIGLTGFHLASERDRRPANVAIVLDRSGSMEGEKIERAKEAAVMALSMLDERDIVSIITYSDTVSVLVPATRVSDRSLIVKKIHSIYADGSTALFAGISKGADEVGKFLDMHSVNRVILLSDGLANVGPDSPAALGDLGASLRTEGISVTTVGLGLGYNEDLMFELAEKSDGNHAFVENSKDLVRIFEYEFKDILSVVAPQIDDLNRGPWKSLEGGVRRLVEDHDDIAEVYVFAGPYYDPGIGPMPELPLADEEHVVPTGFWMIVYTTTELQVCAFVMPQQLPPSREVAQFITAVDVIEGLTGLDFFSLLSTEVETEIEERIALEWYQDW